MKNLTKFIPLVLLSVLCVMPLFGQNPIDIGKDVWESTNWDELLGKETLITSGLILLAGYLSPFVPFIRKIPEGAFRVLAFAVIIVIALVKGFGFGSWVGSAIAYFFSTSMYELVLKWIVPSRKAKEKAASLYGEK